MSQTHLTRPRDYADPLGVTLRAVAKESGQTGASGLRWWKELPQWIQAFVAVATFLLAVGAALGVVHAASSPPQPPEVSASPTAVNPAVVSGGLYHQGPLALAYNTGADLDSPPNDPQWGEPSASTDGGGADLWSEYPGFAGINGAGVVTIDSGTDTACQNATGWLKPNSFQDLNLGLGSYFCVRTSQGRYSLLRVTAINSTSNTISLLVKTFKKPGD